MNQDDKELNDLLHSESGKRAYEEAKRLRQANWLKLACGKTYQESERLMNDKEFLERLCTMGVE